MAIDTKIIRQMELTLARHSRNLLHNNPGSPRFNRSYAWINGEEDLIPYETVCKVLNLDQYSVRNDYLRSLQYKTD